MTDYAEFASIERRGWTSADTINAYVTHFGPVTRAAIPQMIAAVGAGPGARVLDLCCGQGDLTAALAATGAEVTGLDFSADFLARAGRAAPGATLVEGDAQAMPFEDTSFDAVLCNQGLCHVPDQPRALAEIARVLVPGGRAALTCWVAPGDNPAFDTVFAALKEHADLSARPPQPDFFLYSDPDQARDALAQAGLTLSGHRVIEAEWVLGTPDELYRIFSTATVSMSILLRLQDPDRLDRIRDLMRHMVKDRFAAGGGYRVPVRMALAVAGA